STSGSGSSPIGKVVAATWGNNGLVLVAVISFPLLDALHLLPATSNDAGYMLAWAGAIVASVTWARMVGSSARAGAANVAAARLGLVRVSGSGQLWRYPLPLFDSGAEKAIANVMVGRWRDRE